MKYYFFTYTIFTLFLFGNALVPSYIKVCGKRNPDLDGCIKKSVEALRPKLKEGIPELEVPSSNPFFLPDGLPLSDLKDITVSARNIKVWNMPEFAVQNVHLDLEKNKVEFNVFFKKLRLEGEYDFEAKIVVPLSGSGPLEIEAENVTAKGNLVFQLKKTKAGTRLFFSTIKLKLEIGDYRSSFSGGDGSNASLNEAINAVINGNREEIIARFTPSLEKAISAKVLDLANRVCRKFTYEELFPDRE